MRPFLSILVSQKSAFNLSATETNYKAPDVQTYWEISEQLVWGEKKGVEENRG